ncbi:MAG: cobalt-precorrin-5B (C(1))-methyltransferase CbiD [Moorellales bacterium]
MSGGLVLVTGGARSGKSRFAEDLAAASGRKVTYIATAVAQDEEMRQRIERHRQRRPRDWETIEEPLDLARTIRTEDRPGRVLLIDCLGVYVSNLLSAYAPSSAASNSLPPPEGGKEGKKVAEAIEDLVQATARARAEIIVVSNEVGWGTAPAYPLGRAYQQWLGWANQRLAAVAREVYLVVCGLPLELKSRVVQVQPRWGFTTGTCAAVAAKAATRALYFGGAMPEEEVGLPDGSRVRLPVRVVREEGRARVVVVKDAGDDPDVTHGIEVVAEARREASGEVVLEAGAGIGTVTRPGLPVPVGEPAINPVPRSMILEAVKEVLPPGAGVRIILSIPGGEELAGRTMNPRLGIVGGLSVLGTTGRVRPMSQEAMLTALRLQVEVAVARGLDTLVLVPGAKGRRTAEQHGLPEAAVVETGNFVGELLTTCAQKRVRRVLLWGHAGKLVKLAGGSFNTHSRAADARREIIGAWAAAEGASREAVRRLLSVATVEEAQGVMEAEGLSRVWSVLAERASEQARCLVGGALEVGTVLLDHEGKVLGHDQKAVVLMRELRG